MQKSRSFSSIVVKWLYQNGGWTWAQIAPVVEWQSQLSWADVQQAVVQESIPALIETWQWSATSGGESQQSSRVTWLKEVLPQWSEDRIWEWGKPQKAEWRWYTPVDSAYPDSLYAIEECPPVLWCSQAVERFQLAEFSERRPIAVVGSRRMTAYGELATNDFVKAFVHDFQIPIISGGAIGVDARAHTTCLESGGQTIAVLPQGCQQIPRRYDAWLRHENFLAVTEFSPEQSVRRWHFRQRNRLIAGLAAAVLVVEAAQKSGTLLTAAAAFLQGKEVCVLTQPRTSAQVEGIFSLIENGAHLVSEPRHVARYLFPLQDGVQKKSSLSNRRYLSGLTHPLEQAIVQYVLAQHGQAFVEQCRQAVQAEITVPSDWSKAVLTLELRGILRQEMGVFRLVPTQ